MNIKSIKLYFILKDNQTLHSSILVKNDKNYYIIHIVLYVKTRGQCAKGSIKRDMFKYTCILYEFNDQYSSFICQPFTEKYQEYVKI